MMWLYLWVCGLFYLGGSLDELPKGIFKRILFYLSCFIEGSIATPIAIGAAVWLYINNNEKKDDTRRNLHLRGGKVSKEERV